VINRALAAIDRHRLLVGLLLCALPLAFVVGFSGIFVPQWRTSELPAAVERATAAELHNIFDDDPQAQETDARNPMLDLTEEECRRVHGIYDGIRCIVPHLAN